jgi:hypothetical protein
MDKHRKYDDLAQRHECRFRPLVISTYGIIHRELLAAVCELAIDLPGSLRGMFIADVLAHIQLGLIAGNGRVILQSKKRIVGTSTSYHYGHWIA